jgi:aspartate racemase
MITEASLHLKKGGAKAIVLCANTMHMIADKLEKAIGIPVINIAAATAACITAEKLKTVGLLGTKFTMEQDFFTDKLKEHNIQHLIPNEADREFIHHTIFEELGKGVIKEETKIKYLEIIQHLISEGAEGIVLGCTEIPLLIQPENVRVPLFDTTLIHSQAAVKFILNETVNS